MTNSDEIKKAIGAHGIWKQRLQAAIASGKSDATPAQVEADNQCDFGRWLCSLPASDRSSDHYKKVQAAHAQFHQEAGKALKLAVTGQKAAAEQALSVKGTFSLVSSKLTVAMMEWNKALGH